ncbi:hypothetical protein CY34DRAFT_88258, partial [Suillus luteus UH-Slu-Lm8-n1]
PKADDIDEDMKPINKNIKALSDRWVCHKKPGCSSDYCYPNPGDNGSHVCLTFPLLECWAAAMEKGPEYATLEMPPNHSSFSMISSDSLGRPSLLSVRRQQLDEQSKKATQAEAVPAAPAPTPAQAMPIINVNFPPEMFQAIRAASGMNLMDFCSAYELSQILQSKLSDHGFTSSHSLRYVTIDDLQKAGLLCGELAELKDAVARWCGE